MDDKTQQKIDQASDTFAEKLATPRWEIYDPLARKYKGDRGYSDSLAQFLATAQSDLIYYAINLNRSLRGEDTLKNYLKNLENILTTLSDFNETIKAETGYGLYHDDYYPKKQIEHALDVLQTKPSSWEKPKQENKFNDVLLKQHPIFFVQPVNNTETDASEANQLREFHLRLSKAKQHQQENQQGKVRGTGVGRKLYTVFVGSTFNDLKKIRAAVLKQLNSTEEYKAIGMEDFPAVPEKQLKYIKDRLKDIDIYVLIIGGRYGSFISENDKDRPDEEDKSFTQKEYELARADPDVKVLPFVCNHPKNLDSYQENDAKSIKLLKKFIKTVEDDSLTVKYWKADLKDTGEIEISTPDQIASDVLKSVVKVKETGTLRGWIRGERPEPEQ